jgi:hypothetical protein
LKYSETSLGALFGAELPAHQLKRFGVLLLQSVLMSAVALLLPMYAGYGRLSFLSVFLVSAALADRLNFLLEENRINIIEKQMPSRRANGVTLLSVLGLFVGMLIAYTGAAVIFAEEYITHGYRIVLEIAGVSRDDILPSNFGIYGSIFRHNIGVLLGIVLLGFLYRSFGAMLALAWNACTWSFVLTVLATRALELSDKSPLTFVFISFAAITPHLIVEGFAYVMGSVAAIFLSKAIIKYETSDPVFRSVLRSCARIFAMAVALIALSALLEARWAPLLLSQLH